MYKIYRKNNYLIIDSGGTVSEKYLAKDILVQEVIEDVSYEIFGILPKLGNTSNQLLHGVSIPNILKENNSPYTANEWVDFYTVNTGFFFELTNGDSGSIPESQFVDNYSALPDPTTVAYQIWICENPEGTQWLPGSIGGTYYPEGGYVSDGVKWIYHKDSYQATQGEVNAGTVTNKWVSPSTFENASKWSTKYDTSNPSGFVSGPGIAVTDTIPLYDGTTGKLIKSSSLTANITTSTGIISGGYISIGSPITTFTISDGSGIIVNALTNTATKVTWSGKTNVVVTNIATQPLTFVKINSVGTVIQDSTPPTTIDFVDFIVIGVIVHPTPSSITSVASNANPITHLNPKVRALSNAIGLFNISGNIFSANGANLSINKSSGSLYNAGSNWNVDNKNPDILTVGSYVAPTIVRLLRTGISTSSTFIDPDNYDLGGVLTAVGNNRWTIQHVSLFAEGTVVFQYGQNTYSSFAAAQSAVKTELYTNAPNVQFALFRAFLIVKKGSLNLASDVAAGIAQFIDTGKFGESAVGAGASTTTLQQAYDNSVDPEIITDTIRDGFTIRRGSASDTDKVLDLQNGVGVTTASITGAGVITGSNLSGNNTGDNATNTTYTNDYRAANFVAGINYQAPVSLTTIGTSGPATFIGNTLNIPNYATGGGGGGNSTTQTVDFGSNFTDKAQIVVTGQSWVTSTSEIVASIKTPTGVDPDEMRLFEFDIIISDLVVGVGFTITVYSEPEATGAYDVMCIGV